MLLTEEQRLLIKTKQAETKLHVSVYKPDVLLSCQVNSSTISTGEASIPFDNVGAGAYSNVYEFVTVLVGTTAGASDIGKIWARGASSGILYVGMNTIPWKNNYYITVLDIVEVWNRPFSIELVEDDIVYLVDGDTAFTSNDAYLGTVISMGGNRAAFVGESLYWDCSNSENVYGDDVWYNWEFEGAAISNYSGTTPGDVVFDTVGFHKVKLTATSDNNAVDVAYRYISIYDTLGNNSPYEFVSVQNWQGSRNEGGWVMDITIGLDSVADIYDGALVTIFAENRYGNDKVDLFNTLFSGYIIENTITYNYQSNSVSFTLGSALEVAKYRPMTALSVDSSDGATAWTEITEMTLKKFLYYYMKNYSTLISCLDMEFDFEDKFVKYFTTLNETLYENIFQGINTSLLGNVVCDRNGKAWFELEPQTVDSAESYYTNTFGLEDSDYMGEVNIFQQQYGDMGFLEIGGFSNSGSSYDAVPFLSDAPDTSYVFYHGSPVELQGLIVNSQNDLNIISGNLYAHRNAKYPETDMSLFPVYFNFDIAPIEIVPISVSEDKNNMGISWNNKYHYIKEISYEFNPKNLSMVIHPLFHEITQGFPGETLEIPEIENTPIETPEISIGLPGFPIIAPPISIYPEEITPPPEEVDGCLIGDYPNGAYMLAPDKLYLDSRNSDLLKATMYMNGVFRPQGVMYESMLALDVDLQYLVGSTWYTSTSPSAWTCRALNGDGNIILNAMNEYETQNADFFTGIPRKYNSWFLPLGATEFNGLEVEVYSPPTGSTWDKTFNFLSGGDGWVPVPQNPAYPNGDLYLPASYDNPLNANAFKIASGKLYTRTSSVISGYDVINAWAYYPTEVYTKTGATFTATFEELSSFSGFGMLTTDGNWYFGNADNGTHSRVITAGESGKKIKAFMFHIASRWNTWNSMTGVSLTGFDPGNILAYRMKIRRMLLYNVCRP